MKLNVVLVDDEEDALNMLKIEILESYPNFQICGTFQNPVEAIKFLTSQSADLLFLDVQMPEMSGFDLLKQIGHHSFDVIFVTAHSNFAIEAIKAEAKAYLLKPLDTSELRLAINHVIHKRQEEENNKLAFITKIMSDSGNSKIKISTQEKIYFLSPKDIIMCKADSNYTIITTREQNILVAKTLKHIQSLLPDNTFLRTHQSYLVNQDHIVAYVKKDGGYLSLTNGHQADISKGKKELFA